MDKKKYVKTNYPNIYKSKHNGTYAIDLSLGYDNITGKRVRTTRTGIESEKAAKELLKKLTSDEKIKNDIVNCNYFNETFEKYLYSCEFEKKLAYNTIKKRIGFYNSYFKDFFQNVKLNKLVKKNGVEFQQYLLQKNISDRTRSDIYSLLIMFINWCVNNDYLVKNPFKGIENFSYEDKKMDFYTIEEFQQLIDYMNNKYRKNKNHITLVASLFCYLLFFLGTRAGETQALKDEDIDYKEYTIEINKSIYFKKGTGNVEGKTKTLSSKRKLYTSKKLIDKIIDYKNILKKDYGLSLSKDNYIFTNPLTSELYNIEAVRHEINKCMDEAGVKHIRLHDFRHSHTALLMSQGEELYYIQKDLGHSRYDITADIYGHIEEKKKKSVASKLEEFI
nr:MAG TPA: Integrase [Caudoviricetes sp.]